MDAVMVSGSGESDRELEQKEDRDAGIQEEAVASIVDGGLPANNDLVKEAPPLNTPAITELIAHVSQVLRTPLHGILSFAHFGRRNIERISKDKLHQCFEKISASVESLLLIINELPGLSKLQSGKMQLMLPESKVEPRT